ncbi:FK506-binding protein 5-like [Helianthus annuus]|uniref:FK506-binding protein 5-like n=1 Tax=Helianthus annuus TaxID=4232 RepID=UPI000B8F8623|nr:FK506-binding protein 5-like [Helianthus annuus]
MGLEDIGDFDFANIAQVKNVESKVDAVAVESKRVADREKILEMRVKKLESENKSLLKKIDTDQFEIDVLKVRVAELEEEKTRRDEQNKYFELKNKELEAAKALKGHEFYMMNKVIESVLGKSIEKRFEEIQVEEVRAKRQAEIEAQMRDKGKSAAGSIAVAERSIVPSLVVENPVLISSVSAIFEENVSLEDIAVDDEEDDSEEDDNEEGDDGEDDDEEKVFYASSHGSDDNNDDNDNQELILRIEPHVEEGEIRYTYTLDEVLKMFNVNEDEFKFDFKEELNAFDINHQPEYEYKYVEDADVYDRVEVEDCSDEEDVSEDTSELPTLMDWGFLPHVNAYAIRRECGVQYFERLYDIMSLPWWDVEELSKVRTLGYPVRKNDAAMWGLIKFEALKNFKHWKPHYPKKVRRVNPESGNVEIILNMKKPKAMKNIPVP